ncbi:effector binding domain-containing protein [Lactococcus muris]|uniref:Effector binding domain-containing protein n=1 Tax=Lactococcus muris TaxID=2941330 RepID=A0ABV4DA93_9LACT
MDYQLETKEAFSLAAIGFSLQSDLSDMDAVIAEKTAFYKKLTQDGTLDALKQSATDDLEWSVNEVYQNKAWNYRAISTSKSLEIATRMVEFPAGDYITVSGISEDADGLFDQLTYKAFGEILPYVTDYAYVGGPNATWRKDNGDGTYSGQFIVPVVKQ